MKTSKLLILTLSALLTSHLLFAQNKWSVELRPNLDFPTTELADEDLNTGFGLEATVNFRFMEHVSAYLGWGFNTFNASDSYESEDIDVDETGYTFGFLFIHPIGSSQKVSFLARAGGIYNHIEVENEEGDIIADSGHNVGWEAGAGVQFELGQGWSLRPQLGYRALSGDIEMDNFTSDFDMNYVSFGIGLAKFF